MIDSVADGWADLDRQLWLDSRKLTTTDPETGARVPVAHAFTLRDGIYLVGAALGQQRLRALSGGCGSRLRSVVDADTPLSQVLEITGLRARVRS